MSELFVYICIWVLLTQVICMTFVISYYNGFKLQPWLFFTWVLNGALIPGFLFYDVTGNAELLQLCFSIPLLIATWCVDLIYGYFEGVK
jgi:hypothetical protein